MATRKQGHKDQVPAQTEVTKFQLRFRTLKESHKEEVLKALITFYGNTFKTD